MVQEVSASIVLACATAPTQAMFQDKVATQALKLTSTAAQAAVQDKVVTLVQVTVQDEATLVLDPTSGIAPTMDQDKGTLVLVLVKAEGTGSGIAWARAQVLEEAGAGGQDRVEGGDKDVEAPIIMYLLKIGRICSTTSQWWKTRGSF